MNIYICGALFLIIFVVPAVGLYFATIQAPKDPNYIDRDYLP